MAQRIDLTYRYGIGEQEYEAAEETLARKYNRVPPTRDVIWVVLDERCRAVSEKGDYRAVSVVCWQQAGFLHEEGKESYRVLQEAARWSLRDLQSSGCKKVQISGARDQYVCSWCRSLDGRVFPIAEALDSMPIPQKDCQFCRCCYLPLVE
jgi:hypothetical protein